ncbi:hypothetical protein PAAG_06301 [Paracoccidioides lutzii Pb01]|uniref:PAS domain-containing protein n=1 Tax=Paracoccidioides lutzii (strain ATCC MYA-826 / Pb01) TaxID=502779 RepID=C1H6B0_PARBA|nr:hypothetical protein PAAG_06301 [Paracoccidioides lutzii Pb01]EEH35254.2 hypothetical protein PAAG_06301 [Paracoccidioides lutzii Pb01]
MLIWKCVNLTFKPDLTPDARIKYTSGAIEDILAHNPSEVVNKSLWDFLHPEELDFAKQIHSRSVRHDMAAGLNYFHLKHKFGYWVRVECVFTVVYDILVASTGIYQRGPKSEQRAADAPVVRRLFTSSPQNPRYDMLSCISRKFNSFPTSLSHEPRAVLFLNRFTRSSNILFATSSVERVLGIRPPDLVPESFYHCMEECCLEEAVRCIESAKSNDTTTYLRFWFRNPLLDENDMDDDTVFSSEEEERSEDEMENDLLEAEISRAAATHADQHLANSHTVNKSHLTTDLHGDVSASTSYSQTPASNYSGSRIQVEAVVSCSSDGLVVVLRRARPPIPHSIETQGHPVYSNGLLASSWGTNYAASVPQSDSAMEVSPRPQASGGPEESELVNTIRDVAALAWAVVGANSSFKLNGRGSPTGESKPPD